MDTCGVVVQSSNAGTFPVSHPLLKFAARIGGYQGTVMLDCGATNNFISEAFVSKNHLATTGLTPARIDSHHP